MIVTYVCKVDKLLNGILYAWQNFTIQNVPPAAICTYVRPVKIYFNAKIFYIKLHGYNFWPDHFLGRCMLMFTVNQIAFFMKMISIVAGGRTY